jgi:hypothetical protein
VVWLPDGYDAGIAISDDPDNGSFESFKRIYDVLADLGFPTTRSMWVWPAEEPTGTPPITGGFFAPVLSEPSCLEYCRTLHEKGFELCLHGASSGNNTRQRTLEALEFQEATFGPNTTFICHSKNAENLYWDSRCIHGRIAQALLRRYSDNQCFGEVPDSRYFWGDVCRQKVRYIRLFRTNHVNTLAFNPSMPYHDFHKPFVNYWFSATKTYLPRVAEAPALDGLCAQHGLSLLYQYMHKYVGKDGAIDPRVVDALTRLAADDRILAKPVSWMLNRLAGFKLLFTAVAGDTTYLVNASTNPIDSVQIRMHDPAAFGCSVPFSIDRTKKRANVTQVAPMSVVRIRGGERFEDGSRHRWVIRNDVAVMRLPLGTVVANLGDQPASIREAAPGFGGGETPDTLPGGRVSVRYRTEEARRLEVLIPIRDREIWKLFLGQAKILLREHLVLGRDLSTEDYFADPGKVEDLSNW